MIKFFKLNKFLLQTVFLFFLLTNSSFSIEKIYRGDYLSNYLSGVISLRKNEYEDSYSFLRNLENLENDHSMYSKVFLESLINNFKIYEAFRYSVKLSNKKKNFYQSDIVVVSKFIKSEKFKKAFTYINSVEKQKYSNLQELIREIVFNWVKIKESNLNYNEAIKIFNSMDSRYMNLKKINKMFLNCYFETPNLEANYQRLINDDATDFSRYTFFYVDYLLKKNNYQKANSILNNQLQNTPRNLLLNQLKGDIEINKKNLLQNNFNCKNISHIVAEIFYITANALSSQSLYALSNFYLNIAKYLNQDFYSYNTLLAENFVMMGNYQEAEKIYLLLKKIGETYDWHSSKQIAIMDVNNENTNKAIRSMQKSYQNLKKPNLYQTYDLANFLKNNEKFSQSIKYYSEVLKKISETHELYPKAKDGRGIAFEQLNKWDQAEKDFLDSLKVKPDQAYVMNYLAYSWIEKGININKSLRMLERANRLRTNDGYIIDSLGWALFKLKKYDEAKKYLQKAVKLMPSDPVINDHFADTLWMNGEKIQARYYWKYVLSLEKTKISLKDKIAKKILNGPASLN